MPFGHDLEVQGICSDSSKLSSRFTDSPLPGGSPLSNSVIMTSPSAATELRFLKTKLITPKISLLHKNHLSLVHKQQHLAEPRVIRIAKKGARINRKQISSLWGWFWKISVPSNAPQRRQSFFYFLSASLLSGERCSKSPRQSVFSGFCSSNDLGLLQFMSLPTSFSLLSSPAKLTIKQSHDSYY